MRNSPSSTSSTSSPAITKMILDALPRNMPKPFEMAPNTLRWEIGKSQLSDALDKIEKAFRGNEFVENFTLEQGQLSSTQFFIQVVYARVNNP